MISWVTWCLLKGVGWGQFIPYQLRDLKERLNNRLRAWRVRPRVNSITDFPTQPVRPELKNKFCAHPFEMFELYAPGITRVCCGSWLPRLIGDYSKSSLDQVWNSRAAQEIRESILDGSFKYCVHTLCPHIQNGSLPNRNELAQYQGFADPNSKMIMARHVEAFDRGDRQKAVVLEHKPFFFNLCYDKSCNLSCPSCRTSSMNFASGPEYESRRKIQDKLVRELLSKPTDDFIKLSITGTGDPFASRLFRELLFGLDGGKFPNLQINLQTNGLMFTRRYWDKMERIHKNIVSVLVSYDAATPETYVKIRRGGNWFVLQENVKMLAALRKEQKLLYLRLDFVVQSQNFREMRKFVELGTALDTIDQVYFSQISDWFTWDPATFKSMAIWQTDHPDYNDFMDVLIDPIFDHPKVDLGNLTSLRLLALERKQVHLGLPREQEVRMDTSQQPGVG